MEHLRSRYSFCCCLRESLCDLDRFCPDSSDCVDELRRRRSCEDFDGCVVVVCGCLDRDSDVEYL